MDWVYDNDFDSFSLEIGEFIVARNILLADITDAVFMVKESKIDADVDAKATLTLGNGLELVAGATELDARIKARFRAADFGIPYLEICPKYYIGLGIKVSGMSKFLELTPVDNTLRIALDFIHD